MWICYKKLGSSLKFHLIVLMVHEFFRTNSLSSATMFPIVFVIFLIVGSIGTTEQDGTVAAQIEKRRQDDVTPIRSV